MHNQNDNNTKGKFKQGDCTIRELTSEDLPIGCKIVSRYLPDQVEAYNKYFKKYSFYYLGCFKNKKLIGLAFGLPLWEIDPKQDQHFLLDGIAVLEEFRSLGYGSKLLKEWERRVFANQPLQKIGLGTEGEGACRFYERNGYRRNGYLSFKGLEGFVESDFVDHPNYLRFREDGDTVIIYLCGDKYNEEEEQRIKSELSLDELVILYEKSKP